MEHIFASQKEYSGVNFPD